MLMHFKEHVTPMSMLSRRLFLTVLSAGTGVPARRLPTVLAGAADAAAVARATALQPSLAPYVPTPQDVVERMLELAHVGKDDVVYDLGSGDGRLVITAAKKYGAKGVGVDIDPERISEAKANAEKAGVQSLVEFRQQDALTVDVSPATVVTLLSAVVVEHEAAADPHQAAQAGLAHRLASVQHGRLAAGEERNVHRFERRDAHALPLDHRRTGAAVMSSLQPDHPDHPRSDRAEHPGYAGHAGFTLHPTLAADTVAVTRLELSRVLLRDDRTFPWVILVPERPRVRELFELECAERGLLMEEIALLSTVMRDLYQPHKINVAALGNQVEQLHVHVIARFHHDPAWPRPI